MYNLTGAYWIRDEAPYLAEYIEFHILQGFDHFIFYDNKSTDDTAEMMVPYIKAGLVELRQYPPHITQRNNFWMMNHLCKEQEGLTKWLHFHAIDERIWSPGTSLVEALKPFERYAGVAVGWKLFNSNKKGKKEPGLIIERFTSESEEPNHHIKTIVQPGKAVGHAGCPHIFNYVPGNYCVDEYNNKVTSPWNKPSYPMQRFINHHYVTMSKEEFDVKMDKGLLDHPGAENKRRVNAEAQWNGLEASVKGDNTELLAWVEPVKEALRERYKSYPELLAKVTSWYNL